MTLGLYLYICLGWAIFSALMQIFCRPGSTFEDVMLAFIINYIAMPISVLMAIYYAKKELKNLKESKMKKERTVSNWITFEVEFARGNFPHERHGQAFCNTFSYTNPDLFYCEDKEKIRKMIEEIVATDFTDKNA